MHLYITNVAPLACVEALDDHRLEKNIRDVASLLQFATGSDVIDPKLLPESIVSWITSSRSNANWTFAYALFACEEWGKRFAVYPPDLKHIEECRSGLSMFPDTRKDQSDESKEPMFPVSFVNTTPFQEVTEVKNAYRMMLNEEWDHDEHAPVWSNRKPADWNRWKSRREDYTRDQVVAFSYHYRQKDKGPR